MEAGNNYNTVHSAYVAKTTATQTACLLHIRNGQGTVTFGHWMTSSADNAGDWIWKAQKAKDLLSGTFLSSPLVVMMLPSAVLTVLDSGLCSEVSEISLPSLSPPADQQEARPCPNAGPRFRSAPVRASAISRRDAPSMAHTAPPTLMASSEDSGPLIRELHASCHGPIAGP